MHTTEVRLTVKGTKARMMAANRPTPTMIVPIKILGRFATNLHRLRYKIPICCAVEVFLSRNERRKRSH